MLGIKNLTSVFAIPYGDKHLKLLFLLCYSPVHIEFFHPEDTCSPRASINYFLAILKGGIFGPTKELRLNNLLTLDIYHKLIQFLKLIDKIVLFRYSDEIFSAYTRAVTDICT